MLYALLLILHLAAAVAFIGTLFYQVVIWRAATAGLPQAALGELSARLSQVTRRVLHGVVLVLYGAGLGLAWQHRAALADPLSSAFASLLSLKILLALSIVGHYLAIALLLRRGRLDARRSQRLHLAILLQMGLILVLAKAMFYLSW
jgi:hypothetical protein